MKLTSKLLPPLALAGALALVPVTTSSLAAADSANYQELETFMSVYERVKSQYVDQVDDHTLIKGAIDGMLASLDPHSSFVEATAARHGIEKAIQASVGVSDGASVWALRYSTERQSRTLFVSAEAEAIKQLHIDNPRLNRLRDEDRLIVSEPLADLPGVWTEIPESTVMIIQPGPDESRPFEPRYEPAAGNGAPVPAA